MLRLGGLPEGYIYPKAERAVRDVWRQRSHLVRPQTANVLSLPNSIVRNTGVRLSAKRLNALTQAELQGRLPAAAQVLAVTSRLAVLDCLRQQIPTLEHAVMQRLKHSPADEPLVTVDGLGAILAPTLVLETGQMGRFPTGGHYASYCRWGKRTTISPGKRKGRGNVKHGKPSLEWAYMEAAQFAIRFSPRGQRFYQRQQAKRHLLVARKAVAHKLSRACYYLMRDLGPFEGHKACG